MRNGAHPDRDLQELWKRIVFSICVSNTDDHLRNHGFLLEDNGWALSPAYDVNPVVGGTHLSLNITGNSGELSLELAREIAPSLRIGRTEMAGILAKITGAVKGWRQEAANAGISRREMEEMQPAFDQASAE
jgi:serine/threonine-protein kinase HipA